MSIFEDYKIYGPYLSKTENRRVICLVHKSSKKRTSMSYARYLMTEHLGKKIDPKLVVDHIDNDSLNDTIENYQLITKSENNTKDKEKTMLSFVCPVCDKEFEREIRQVWNKTDPACSRKCGGIKSHW
jgi:hypothetical protein